MKKLLSALLIAALLCLACGALAESENAFLEKASQHIMTVNFLINQSVGYEQLFTDLEEVVPNEIIGFASDEVSLQALVIANSYTGELDVCTFITDDPSQMLLAERCTCFQPICGPLLNSAEMPDSAMEASVALAGWFDSMHADALAAFEGGETYGGLYEGDDFYAELMIVPLDGYSRMMINYYFYPYAG